MTLSYAGSSSYRTRPTLPDAPPAELINDRALREAVARWHALRAQASEARRAVEAAQAAVKAAGRSDAQRLAEAVRKGEAKLPTESVHRAEADLAQARRLATAAADAAELTAREIVLEAERVAQSPEADRLRAEDERLADLEAEALAALEKVQAQRRHAAEYLAWLSDPTKLKGASGRWRR